MSRDLSENIKALISIKLVELLPGIEAQRLMAPYSRISHKEAKDTFPNTKEAGVMMLIYEKNNHYSFALIKRNSYKGVHSAQVSFPGGKKEGNESMIQTAIRETEEEIGINGASINVLGDLTPIYIPPSKMLVHPYIGWYDGIPTFKKDDREVDYIIEVSLSELLDDSRVRIMDMKMGKSANSMTIKKVPYFDFNNEIIWGATAMMLSEAKEFFKTIGLPF